MNVLMTHIKNSKDFILFFFPVISYFLPTTPNKKMILVIIYLFLLQLFTLYQLKKKNDKHEVEISTKDGETKILNNELEQKKILVFEGENQIKELKSSFQKIETDYERLYESYSAFINVDFAKIVYSMQGQYSKFYAKNHGKSKLKDDLEGMKTIAQNLMNLSLEKQEELKNVERTLPHRSHSK